MKTEPAKPLLDTGEIEAALLRAAKRAEKIARETGTPLVVWENGRIAARAPQPENDHAVDPVVVPTVPS